MNKLVIGRDAYDKIRYYVDRTDFEISGLGVVENIKGVPTVTDVILLKQENSHTETELDPVALNKADYDFMMSGKEGALKFWWHSHNSMDVYWSKTDYEAIDQLTGNGEFFHGVFNHKGEFRIAYTNYKDYNIFIDDMDLEIDENLVSKEKQELLIQLDQLNLNMEAELEADYKKLVTEIAYKYTPSYKGAFPTKQVGVTNMDYIGQAANDYPQDEWFESWKAMGTKELTQLGYSKKQIEHLNEAHDTWDAEDLAWLEKELPYLCQCETIEEYFTYMNIY